MAKVSANADARCSFCGKKSFACGPILEGPGDANICGKCAELCVTLAEMMKSEGRRCALCVRPSSEVGWLTNGWRDRFICGECLDRIVTAAVASAAPATPPRG